MPRWRRRGVRQRPRPPLRDGVRPAAQRPPVARARVPHGRADPRRTSRLNSGPTRAGAPTGQRTGRWTTSTGRRRPAGRRTRSRRCSATPTTCTGWPRSPSRSWRGRRWSPSRRASSRSTIRCEASRSRTAARCATCCRTPADTRSTARCRSRHPDAAGSTRTPASSSPRPRSRRRRECRSSSTCAKPCSSRSGWWRRSCEGRLPTACGPRRRDLTRFAGEMMRPVLLAPPTASDAIRPQYADLSGIVPDVGSFTPCPWGLGVEIHGAKHPHWMGRDNSPETFGHFGGAGTMMWVDPIADCALVALTDRPIDEWMTDALTTVARSLRRRPGRGRRVRQRFQHGDRVRVETIGDDGLAARALRLRRRARRRAGSRGGDARRRPQERHDRRPLRDQAGHRSPTSSSACSAPTCSTTRRSGRVSSTSGRPKPKRPGWRSEPSPASATACATRDEGYALAELFAGGEQYVLRAIRESNGSEFVRVRADRPL